MFFASARAIASMAAATLLASCGTGWEPNYELMRKWNAAVERSTDTRAAELIAAQSRRECATRHGQTGSEFCELHEVADLMRLYRAHRRYDEGRKLLVEYRTQIEPRIRSADRAHVENNIRSFCLLPQAACPDRFYRAAAGTR